MVIFKLNVVFIFTFVIINCNAKMFFTNYMDKYLNDDFWNATIWAIEEDLYKSCKEIQTEHGYVYDRKLYRIKIDDYVLHGPDLTKNFYQFNHDALKTGIYNHKHIFKANLNFFHEHM